MSDLSNARDARTKLKERGKSDVKHAEMIADLTAKSQAIIAQMNEAKIAAMREAEKPFLEQLKELDEEMAVLITLMG